VRSLLTIAALTIVSLAVVDRPAGAEDLPDISIRTKPYKVLLKAAMLLPPSEKPMLTAPEADLFEDAMDGKVSGFSLREVALICAGVEDHSTLNHYTNKIDAIVKEARKAIANGKTDNEKADLLAHHLYDGPLHGGYVDSQVDFLKLLDEGKFNCVSSSLLYNMVGSELDLQTNCVTLPNHVFLVMGDLVIEPVSGITCTHFQHAATVNKCWNDSPEFSKRYFDDSHMYLSTNVDLIAEVYMDRSTELDVKEQKLAESAVESLKAVCMDSKNPMFRQSAECQMGKWFQSAIDQHDVKMASKIAKLYAELFTNPPQASTMQRLIAETQAQLAQQGLASN
jgi:hypothetical protein